MERFAMKMTDGKLAKAMFVEIMQVIEKYDGTLYVPTVLGVLEVAKIEIVQATLNGGEDETD